MSKAEFFKNGKPISEKGVARREQKRQYYLKNKERILKKTKEYRKNNKEKSMTIDRRFSHTLLEAQRRNIEFSIDIQFFEENALKNCYYCGSEPKKTNGSYMDRLDCSVGYIAKNIVPCCNICNKSKNVLNEKDFYNHIVKIYKNIKNRLED